jgi:quercetin dioxygenase-like cupin family protein
MHVVRTGDSSERPVENNPIFIGTVHMRPLIPAEVSPNVTVSLVRFTDGARNKRHIHSADQILYITEGDGIVADAEAEHRVSAGDIVHVGAGTAHWHGAQEGKSMAHLSILPPCKTDIVE